MYEPVSETRGYCGRMQHVILMSSRIDRLPALLGGSPGDIPVAYVPTAADGIDEHGYVAAQIDQLTRMGFPVTPLPLAELSAGEVEQGLKAAGLVFVTGGNVFHLLHHAVRSGFADLVPPLRKRCWRRNDREYSRSRTSTVTPPS